MTLKCGLPPASGFIVMCEQTRLSMKVHSYFRSFWNGPPSSRLKLAYPGDEKPPSTIFLQKDSSLSQYLYFIFCPSLLYR